MTKPAYKLDSVIVRTEELSKLKNQFIQRSRVWHTAINTRLLKEFAQRLFLLISDVYVMEICKEMVEACYMFNLSIRHMAIWSQTCKYKGER